MRGLHGFDLLNVKKAKLVKQKCPMKNIIFAGIAFYIEKKNWQNGIIDISFKKIF